MRVLFFSGALRGTGETRVALNLAQTLREHSDEVFFVSFRPSAEIIRECGFQQVVLELGKEENQSRFLSWLRYASPDVVILADYYLFATSEVRALFDFDDCMSPGIPILTLETVGFSPDRQVLSWISIGKTYVVEPTPAFIRAIIRPCPPHDPSVARERTVYTRLYDGLQTLPVGEREAVRREIGCGEEDKVVFYALPRWGYDLAGRIPWLYVYYMFLGDILAEHLKGLDQRVCFVFVSPRRLVQPTDGSVRAYWLNSLSGRKLLPESRYRSLVLSSDLYVTDVILSCTLGLALAGLIPAISLMNSVTVESLPSGPSITSSFELTTWARECILRMHQTVPGSVFPFVWFPFGLLEEFERLHHGSAYLRAFERCELFDAVRTRATVRGLLFDDDRRSDLRTRQQEYAEMALEQPSLPELLRKVI
jgi:hypothetical protein